MSARKKIVVNASTVLISGGYYLSIEIIRALIAANTFELVIICPNYRKYQMCESIHSKLMVVPRWMLKRRFRFFLDVFWLPARIRHLAAEKVLSLTNIPARTRHKQVFLHDNPYFAVKTCQGLNLTITQIAVNRVRSIITRNRFRFVDELWVQSNYQKNQLLEQYGFNMPIRVIPPSAPILPERKIRVTNYFPESVCRNILCPARYYEHKNIEVLVELACLIERYNDKYRIYITIEERQHRNVTKILNRVRRMKLENILVNLGKISHNQVHDLINQCDAVILPSFLESYSLVIGEAWCHEKPLFTSDIEAIRDTCMDAAFYINPRVATDIRRMLNHAFSHPDELNDKIKKGKQRLSELPPWSIYAKFLSE